jgi:hypothetical protein
MGIIARQVIKPDNIHDRCQPIDVPMMTIFTTQMATETRLEAAGT